MHHPKALCAGPLGTKPSFGGARLRNGLNPFAEQLGIPHLNMFDAKKLPSRKTRHPNGSALVRV
jgi:hypothetical protein